MAEKNWLVVKDANGKWYFHHGKYAPHLVSEIAKTDILYLRYLIDNDAGAISLEGRNYIATLIKSIDTRSANG
jgi:hypothetical protein